jgi:hypothetical protein
MNVGPRPRDAARDAFFMGLAALVLYAITLYPDVAGGDSGELTAAVATGGVIHPPGYPLYALLGKLFLLLPHGTVAWRMNFMSAACDAAAAGILCAAVARWSGSRVAGVVTGALFASAPGIWRYAICAEVFALDNLLVALLLLLAVLYARDRDRRYAMAGALVAGLGMSNHQTFAFTLVPFVVWALWFGREQLLRPRVAAGLLGLFALGLVPYAELPVAASRHAAVTWGAADTWHGFWTHVLRREYGTLRLAPEGVAGAPDRLETLGAWARDVVEQVGWWGLPLAGVGVVASLRTSRESRLGVALVAAPVLAVATMCTLGNLPVRDALHRGIVARFWQQPDVYVFVACGCALAWMQRSVPRWAAFSVAAMLAVLPAALRFRAMDRHGSTLVRSYGAEMLRAAPPGALLLTKGDLITDTVRYLQAAEGARPDVRVVDQELLGNAWYPPLVVEAHPDIRLPGARRASAARYVTSMKLLLDANVDARPVLVCGGVVPGDTSADASYGRWPFGLCEIAHRGTEPVNLDAWLRESEAALPRIDFAGQLHPPGSWEDIVWSDFWQVRATRAAHLLIVAGSDPSRRRYVGIAADILQKLVEENPEVGADVYRNLALANSASGANGANGRK